MSEVQLHLMNDNDIHIVDVVTALMSVCDMTDEAAEIYTSDAHNEGHSVIFTGDKSEAARLSKEFAELGIRTEITNVGGRLFSD